LSYAICFSSFTPQKRPKIARHPYKQIGLNKKLRL